MTSWRYCQPHVPLPGLQVLQPLQQLGALRLPAILLLGSCYLPRPLSLVLDRQTDRQIDRWIDRWIDGWINRCIIYHYIIYVGHCNSSSLWMPLAIAAEIGPQTCRRCISFRSVVSCVSALSRWECCSSKRCWTFVCCVTSCQPRALELRMGGGSQKLGKSW